MDVCDDDHDTVAYSSSHACPVCTLRDDMQQEVDQLKEEKESAIKEAEEYLVDNDKLSLEMEQYKGLKEKLEGMVNERL